MICKILHLVNVSPRMEAMAENIKSWAQFSLCQALQQEKGLKFNVFVRKKTLLLIFNVF